MDQPTTYTKALESVMNKLEEMTAAPVLVAKMDELGRQQGETNNLLRQLNGSVREHGQVLAAHTQWIEDHDQAQGLLVKRVEHVSNKLNATAVVNTALAFIAGALGLQK